MASRGVFLPLPLSLGGGYIQRPLLSRCTCSAGNSGGKDGIAAIKAHPSREQGGGAFVLYSMIWSGSFGSRPGVGTHWGVQSKEFTGLPTPRPCQRT